MSMPAAVVAIQARIGELSHAPPDAQLFLAKLTSIAEPLTVTPASSGTAATKATYSTTALATADPTDTVLAMRAMTPLIGSSLGATQGGNWMSRLPAAGLPYAGMINDAATRNGVEPSLLAGLAWVESGFRPDAVSSAGAIGLGQLMPGTAATLGVDPTDPAANLDGAARMLHGLIEQFGDVRVALAAYNAGPNAITRAGGVLSEHGAHYADTVLAYQARLLATNASNG
jgi:soluble lytic murein transglycosylase-like protein